MMSHSSCIFLSQRLDFKEIFFCHINFRIFHLCSIIIESIINCLQKIQDVRLVLRVVSYMLNKFNYNEHQASR